MTQSPVIPLRECEAFGGLSEEGLKKLLERTNLQRFKIGQILSDPHNVPSTVLLLLRGQCRLLIRGDRGPRTLERLQPGSLVGIASLLRCSPCEWVSAAEEVIAASIPDEAIVDCFNNEPTFRKWCNQTVFSAEVAQTAIDLSLEDPRIHALDPTLLKQWLPSARLLAPEDDIPQLGLTVLASANTELALSSNLNNHQQPSTAQPPFPLRRLHLPDAIDINNNPPAIFREDDIAEAPKLPARSSLTLSHDSSKEQKIKLINGEGPLEATLACFSMLAQSLNLPFRRDRLEKAVKEKLRRGSPVTLQFCGQLATNLGLLARVTKVKAEMAARLNLPVMVSWGSSVALVVSSDSSGITVLSPEQGEVKLSIKQVTEHYSDGLQVLMLDRTVNTKQKKFGASWLWPAVTRYRNGLLLVLLTSFVVQLFGLANPLLIQVIIDKVINQRSLDTLQILGIALVVVTVMGSVLSGLRTYLFTEITNRIDQRLGAEVIDHLLRLPLNYFDKRPVGELGTRVAELEKIRNFLTGQALTSLLDAAFSVVYIVVMAMYSVMLTAVALAVLPIQIFLTVVVAPLFRSQVRAVAQDNAKTQSHLVEVLTGIQTVKAQNVEVISRWKWQDFYARYINRSFDKTITGTAFQETSQGLQQLSQLLVLWIGASLVLKGELSLGQLIAFRIISGYVTQPLLRLSSIWQRIQELKVSFERLGDVLDTPQESSEQDQAKILLPSIDGQVRLEGVSFSFEPQGRPVLKNIDLDVAPGTFVGIVGQSGSGKSTLMKLLSRLYSPNKGRLLIDGYDIDKVELYSLRRQIGIVPQDPLLFSGTVSENIALTNPDASSDDVMAAAKLAGAHDFIMELSSGYSSSVGERGGALSGGQRQRIAIARTLLSNPKLLVMDEATSALDYETERLVCDNLLDQLQDRTVFFITHRLSTIRRADLVVMMHQGAIVEQGTHDSLMAERGRYYALYRQQEASS